MRIVAFMLLAVVLSIAQPAQAQACAPAEVQGGTGSPLRTGATADGWYAYTFCRGEYSVGYWYAYGTWASVVPAAVAEINGARASLEAFRAAVARRLTGQQCEIDGGDVIVDAAARDTHAALCFAMHAAMRTEWPPEPIWRVVPLLTGDGSRPMYTVVNGVRSTTAAPTPRAPGNARCTLTADNAIPSGTSNKWGPVEGLPAHLVALCGRAQ